MVVYNWHILREKNKYEFWYKFTKKYTRKCLKQFSTYYNLD